MVIITPSCPSTKAPGAQRITTASALSRQLKGRMDLSPVSN
jgi:hypothetical protein